jgi:hypothetical protein
VTTPKRHCFRKKLLRGSAVLLLALGGVLPARTLSSPLELKKPKKPYALIYGTVYGPDDHAVYGVRVRIRRSDETKPKWELYSDHAGEFAQRVPAGPAIYVIWPDLKGYKPLNHNKLQAGKPVTVEIHNDERADISLHLK